MGIINNMPVSSGIDTSDATATVDKITEGYTAYAKGEKLTGSDRRGKLIVYGGTCGGTGSTAQVSFSYPIFAVFYNYGCYWTQTRSYADRFMQGGYVVNPDCPLIFNNFLGFFSDSSILGGTLAYTPEVKENGSNSYSIQPTFYNNGYGVRWTTPNSHTGGTASYVAICYVP